MTKPADQKADPQIISSPQGEGKAPAPEASSPDPDLSADLAAWHTWQAHGKGEASSPAAPEEHDPLCSEGVGAGDQSMPCDCHLSRAASSPAPPASQTIKISDRAEEGVAVREHGDLPQRTDGDSSALLDVARWLRASTGQRSTAGVSLSGLALTLEQIANALGVDGGHSDHPEPTKPADQKELSSASSGEALRALVEEWRAEAWRLHDADQGNVSAAVEERLCSAGIRATLRDCADELEKLAALVPSTAKGQ